MKKIMFNDKHGLTEAAIAGTKPMTRREIINQQAIYSLDEQEFIGQLAISEIFVKKYSRYQVGEVVAISQSYKDAGYTKEWVVQHVKPNPKAKPTDPFEKKYPGGSNKMFVKADLMPHSICITDINIERLQDISDEDCLKEGVFQWGDPFHEDRVEDYGFCGATRHYLTPREAFAALIDKVSGSGTWLSNPWVFAYSFELVK